MNTPSPVLVVLKGKELPIVWDRGAIYRADLCGLSQRLADGLMGYSTLCQMIHVMLDEQGRKLFPSAEAVALQVPLSKQEEYWLKVMAAFDAGTAREDDAVKNGTGGAELSP